MCESKASDIICLQLLLWLHIGEVVARETMLYSYGMIVLQYTHSFYSKYDFVCSNNFYYLQLEEMLCLKDLVSSVNWQARVTQL